MIKRPNLSEIEERIEKSPDRCENGYKAGVHKKDWIDWAIEDRVALVKYVRFLESELFISKRIEHGLSEQCDFLMRDAIKQKEIA